MSWVYFARRKDGAVKIGFSQDPRRRCTGLKLTLLACFKGGQAEEAAEHHRWKKHALGNEYFSPTPRLLARIEFLTRAELPKRQGALILVRFSDEEFRLLNEEIARERREHPGRRVTRAGLAKEILATMLQRRTS
jgi:hypothetical protein